MTLISTSDARWSQGERIDFYLAGLTAIDPDTGAELYASNGRRKAGRGTKYTCRVQTGETELRETNKGPRTVQRMSAAFSVSAKSEREAIERANKALARFFGKGPIWHRESYSWTFAVRPLPTTGGEHEETQR